MKSFFLPCSLLSLLLALTLANGSYLQKQSAQWVCAIEHAAAQKQQENALDELEKVYKSWGKRQTYLHVVISHEAINAAEFLFLRAAAYGEAQDAAEFRACLRELCAQLTALAEMEQFGIRNIL